MQMSHTEWIAYNKGYDDCYKDTLTVLKTYDAENTTIQDAIDIIISDKYIKENKI